MSVKTVGSFIHVPRRLILFDCPLILYIIGNTTRYDQAFTLCREMSLLPRSLVQLMKDLSSSDRVWYVVATVIAFIGRIRSVGNRF